MDLLKRELERKKASIEKVKSASGGKRYFRASELRRQLEEAEEKEETKNVNRKHKRNSEEDDEEKEKLKRKEETTGSKKSRHDSKKTEGGRACAGRSNDASNESQLSSEEITRRLRSFGHPIKLFGESSMDRLLRLRQALDEQKNVQASTEESNEFRLGQGHGIRNPFLEKDDEVGGDGRRNEQEVVDQETAADSSKQEEKKVEDDNKLDENDPSKRVYKYFKGLCKQWEDDLNLRQEAVKRTVAGRNETKTFKQCKDYIRPMFKLLKQRRLDESILTKLNNIVTFCLQEEFVKAHDTYIDISIGRAAWPIGVTMVGIHARTGRAKIESSNVAHVMNSELQRKYLTSVKRLMTFAQKKSNADPSKMVR